MTNRETAEAAVALARWFKSQGLAQNDSCAVMVTLLGGIIAQNAVNDLATVGAVGAFTHDLADVIERARRQRSP